MKKILFLHGFFASGRCVPAKTIKEAFQDKVKVLTPDLPVNPYKALELIRGIIDKENPDLLVGNSCGAFYAQMLAPIVGVPALLGNPHFRMTEFLEERKGVQQFKSSRKDGVQEFVIDDEMIEEFRRLEAEQFDFTSLYWKDKVWGLFGEQDQIAHFEPEFMKYYNICYRFPGGHTPTEEETRTWYVPLIEKILMTLPRPEAGTRKFQHFKGGMYRMERTAFDSETQQRMVVYQALYGDQAYWVRPEKMFFEKITRNGKTFSRFLEIDA